MKISNFFLFTTVYLMFLHFIVCTNIFSMENGDLEKGKQPAEHITNSKKSSSGIQVSMQSVKINTVSLKNYYNSTTKTLNLSNMLMGNEQLKGLTIFIKDFVLNKSVETLLLENMGLTEIPSDLLLFALTNKSLKLVSFRDNQFKIAGRPLSPPNSTDETSGSIQIPIDQTQDAASFMQSVASGVGSSSSEDKRRSLSVLSDIASSVWNSIYPELEKEIKNQMENGGMQFYSKVILFDRSIPPFVFTNSRQKKPVTCMTRAKFILARLLFIGVGIMIYALPQLATAYSSSSRNSCDQSALEKMASLCGLSCGSSQ